MFTLDQWVVGFSTFCLKILERSHPLAHKSRSWPFRVADISINIGNFFLSFSNFEENGLSDFINHI